MIPTPDLLPYGPAESRDERLVETAALSLVRHWKRGHRNRRLARRRSLDRFEAKVYSQGGEDGVICEIFRRIGVVSATFAEFGTESGTECNCRFLAERLGWSGLFIEGAEEPYLQLEARYSARRDVQTLNAFVQPETIDQYLRAARLPIDFDLLSIDVDGNDYWIWSPVESVSPRVVVIEYNAALSPHERLVMPYNPAHSWDGTDYFGASIAALRALADAKGYQLVYTNRHGVNAFFVRRDLVGRHFQRPADVAVRPPRYGPSGAGHPVDPLHRPYVSV